MWIQYQSVRVDNGNMGVEADVAGVAAAARQGEGTLAPLVGE